MGLVGPGGGEGALERRSVEGGIEVPSSCTVFEYSSWQEYLSVKYLLYSWRCCEVGLLLYLPDLTICTYLPYLRRYLKVLGTLGASSGDGMPPSRVLLAVLALPQTCPPLPRRRRLARMR